MSGEVAAIEPRIEIEAAEHAGAEPQLKQELEAVREEIRLLRETLERQQ